MAEKLEKSRIEKTAQDLQKSWRPYLDERAEEFLEASGLAPEALSSLAEEAEWKLKMGHLISAKEAAAIRDDAKYGAKAAEAQKPEKKETTLESNGAKENEFFVLEERLAKGAKTHRIEPALKSELSSEMIEKSGVKPVLDSKQEIFAEPEAQAVKKAPVPPVALPIAKSFNRIIPAAEVKKETEERILPPPESELDEKIGEFEHNLKLNYGRMFEFLMSGKKVPEEIYESVREDQDELAKLYRPQLWLKAGDIYNAFKGTNEQKKEKIQKLVNKEIETLESKDEIPYVEERYKKYKNLIRGKKAVKAKEEIYRSELGAIFQKIKSKTAVEIGYFTKVEEKNHKEQSEKQKLKEEYGNFKESSIKKPASPKINLIDEKQREIELARQGAEITLSRINDYQELNALTEKEGDAMFNEKTRNFWKEFAVHGVIGKDKKTGEPTLVNFTDLDGKASIGLLKKAGFDVKKISYVKAGDFIEGGINLDTGKKHGVVLEDDEKRTVFIDHHSDESKQDTCTTKLTYELLTSLGLLEKKEYLDTLVEFITHTDNKTYPDQEKYFKDSWRTILGLQQYINYKNLEDYFESGKKPTEILTEKEIEKLGLKKRSLEQKQKIEDSLKEIKKKEENGWIIDSERYGKILVDLEKKIPAGFDAILSSGYTTYIAWKPKEQGFFITSLNDISENFSQGIKIRGKMWLKPLQDKSPLKINLGDIITAMTDGKFKPEKELEEFLTAEKAHKEQSEKQKLKEEAEKMIAEKKSQLEIIKDAALKFYNDFKKNDLWGETPEAEKEKMSKEAAQEFLSSEVAKIINDDSIAAEIASILLPKLP